MMNNYQMVGFYKLDNFDIRMSLTVIAAFGVITLVSYFNELARAGLLTRRNVPVPMDDLVGSRHTRSASALIQSNQHLHKLNLDLQKMKDPHHVVKQRKSNKRSIKNDEQINFELHLNKNKHYAKSNNSKIHIYSHKNTMPNFYTTYGNFSTKVLSSNLQKLISKRERKYLESAVVLMYQHEPGGHFFKDCFKYIAHSSNKSVSPGISASYRKEWEAQSQRQKDHYKYLYGSVSFGICEQLKHKCLYSIIVSHPIDRLIQTYTTCRKNPSKSFCHFHKLNLKKISIYEFIRVQGNRLFQRLLYYNKHCRLLGEDEICLHDIKTSFVLTNREYKEHLQNVLRNIENWFAVIGLVDYFNDSLAVFDSVLHLNMSTTCGTYWSTPIKPKWYVKLREKLLADAKVKAWLHADLAIYEKLTQVFHRQLDLMHWYNDSKIKHIHAKNLNKHDIGVKHFNKTLSNNHINHTKSRGLSHKAVQKSRSLSKLEDRNVPLPAKLSKSDIYTHNHVFKSQSNFSRNVVPVPLKRNSRKINIKTKHHPHVKRKRKIDRK